MRRVAKVDRNQAEIVQALRAAGAAVSDTSAVGQGFPDVVCSYRGTWHLLEIKDGMKRPSARRLTDAQVRWRSLQHAAAPVVASVDDALRAIGAIEVTT